MPQAWERTRFVGVFGNDLLVDVEAQAGFIGQEKLAVPEGIPSADKVVSPGYVVLAEVLLDEEIRRADVEMKGRRQATGPRRYGERSQYPSPPPGLRLSWRHESPRSE